MTISEPPLRKYDNHVSKTIEDFKYGELFGITPRIFKKGELQHKRYKCLEVVNKRIYLVHPHAEVQDLPADVVEKIRNLGLAECI